MCLAGAVVTEFFHNSRLIRWIQQNKIYQKSETWPGMEPRSLAYQSGTLTITPNYFLCLCEAIIKPYSCLGDSVQFIQFNENLFILEKTRTFWSLTQKVATWQIFLSLNSLKVLPYLGKKSLITFVCHKFLTTIIITPRIKTWHELNVSRLYWMHSKHTVLITY